MLGLVKKIFGDTNERDVKRLLKTVEIINKMEPEFEALSHEEVQALTSIINNQSIYFKCNKIP